MPNLPLERQRRLAQLVFDTIWETKIMRKPCAHEWISQRIGVERINFDHLDYSQCQQVITMSNQAIDLACIKSTKIS